MGLHTSGLEPLSSKTVQICQIDLRTSLTVVELCHRVLSIDEQARADRFHFERDRNRFVIARAVMRFILGEHLGIAPDEVAFSYGKKGKPDLAAPFRESRLKFNLSHSRDCALLALALDTAIGIDIEFINQEFKCEEIAGRFFSPAEVVTLGALSAQERTAGFFSCWTRKEAYIKAVGDGFALPLDSFDVAFGPGTPPGLLRVEASPQELQRWSMYDIPVLQGYAAAMVIEGTGHYLQQQDWTWKI